jgi:8-oxo-dGTP diphosphatase
VSIAYVALVPDLPEPVAGTDASAARWWPTSEIPALAFDHDRILSDAIERARSRLEYTTLATRFVGPTFTLAELRAVYTAVWGAAPELANFRRKVLNTPDFIEPAGASGSAATPTGGRPPELYRAGTAEMISPPLSRPPTPPETEAR